MDSNRKTNVRRKEMIAETFPLESAVNIPEEKILVPTKRKLVANSLNPDEVMENTSLEGKTKMEISISQARSANSTTPTALIATTDADIENAVQLFMVFAAMIIAEYRCNTGSKSKID